MAITFNIQLGKPSKQGRKVYIRCTYKRHAKDFPTAMHLKPAELTKGGRIKNALVANRCAEIINDYRQRAYNLRLEQSGLEPDKVFELIGGNATTDGAFSFTDFANKWLEKSKRRGNINYQTALRALHAFMRKDNLTATDITARSLTAFAESLNGKPRAQSLYLSAVAKIFNDMREYYYNEERGESLIRHDLRRLKLPKQGAAAVGGKRALAVVDARKLLALSLGLSVVKNLDKPGEKVVKNLDKLGTGDEVGLSVRVDGAAAGDEWTTGGTTGGQLVEDWGEDGGQLVGRCGAGCGADNGLIIGQATGAADTGCTAGDTGRAGCGCDGEQARRGVMTEAAELAELAGKLSGRACLAADCWALSFCLMGMNSVDIYELRAVDYNERTITYNRHKTRGRRADGARMVVAVPLCLRSLFAKYRGEGGALFDFSQRYANYKDFQRALNIGLKEIGGALGLGGGLTFYSARHSFASIAVNAAGVDKYTVSEMLCHVDSTMRVTDTYIAKDWRRVHEAAAKVLAAVGLEG